MPLDDQKRAPVAWTQLAQQPVCGSVVEMRKRHPACAGQRRPLNDAVMDQRIVNDYIVPAEQMPDHGDIRRMAADQNDTILAAMDLRQRPLQLAVDRPFTRDRTARRDRSPVTVNRSLRRAGDMRMTIEADVIVRSKVHVSFVADQSFCPGDPLMHPKERIGDAEKIRGFADHANLPKPIEFRRVEPRCEDAALFRTGGAWRALRGSNGRCR